jgi:23S rRNA (cytosine1962-C5)-methyltransferase
VTAPAFESLLAGALARRRGAAALRETDAWRAFDGDADGLDGVFVDRYGPGAVLALHDDADVAGDDAARLARAALAAMAPDGVEAVYLKRFVRDRSRGAPAGRRDLYDPSPAAGQPLPPSIIVSERGVRYEVHLYDGFSTGLFLDHREHRTLLAGASRGRRVLNAFAYTCAFGVAIASGGAAEVVNVDVSQRSLSWGTRNAALNGLGEDVMKYVRMDARRYIDYAAASGVTFDLVILDPPTFGAASRRRKVAAWSIARDLAPLLRAARRILAPNGTIFASSNARELCAPERMDREIAAALGTVRLRPAPPPPVDFPAFAQRVAARWVEIR